MPKVCNTKHFAKLYSFGFNKLYALGLTLSIYEIWRYVWAMTDNNPQEEQATTKIIWITFAINCIASIAATFYMNQEKENMEKNNIYSQLSKKDVAVMLATGLVPAAIVAAGAAEFVDTIIPISKLSVDSNERKIAYITAGAVAGTLSIPGQVWSYSNNILDKTTFSFSILQKVFAHPKASIKKKCGYTGLLFMQIVSNVLDNIPEALCLDKLPLPRGVTLYVGLGIALIFSTLDLNNEISAVFGEILDKLNTTAPHLTINDKHELLLNNETTKSHGWFASTIINFLSGLNAAAYWVSAPVVMTLFDTPFTEKSHGQYYYLLNMLKLLPIAVVAGSFSAYGQFKMVKPAVEKGFGYTTNRYSFHSRITDLESADQEQLPLIGTEHPTYDNNAVSISLSSK